MKKSTQKWIILCIVAVIGLILFGWYAHGVHSFLSPGIHTFGRFAHLEFQEPCYFLETGTDANNPMIDSQGVFTISGILQDHFHNPFSDTPRSGKFHGHLEVSTAPISMEDGFGEMQGTILKDRLLLHCQGLGLTDYEGPYYIVEILQTSPQVVVVYVLQNGVEEKIAVCGKTEAQALENHQIYLDHVH